MKTKTIKNILRRKFEEWLKSIPKEAEALRELIRKNTMITGGAITSMLLGEKVEDYDFYFRDKATALAVARYYVTQFRKLNPEYTFKDGRKMAAIEVLEGIRDGQERVAIMVRSSGIASSTQQNNYQYFESLDPGSPEQEGFISEAVEIKKRDREKNGVYIPIFLTSNAITLSNKVQLILRFFGDPDEIHENYDFVHCMNYWTSWNGDLILRQDSLEAIIGKELVYKGSLYPICSLFRLRKFIRRGWSINAGQLLKIAMQINKLDLFDVNVLEDQLIGVDVAYMFDLIKRLRETGKDKVDELYICRLIDEIF